MDSEVSKKYAPYLINNDSLSDTVHDGLDKNVLNHSAYPGPWSAATSGSLLVAALAALVVELSPTLDKKYLNNFLAQMATEPELEEALVDCWKIQIKTFRRFSECQKCHLLSGAYHYLIESLQASNPQSVAAEPSNVVLQSQYFPLAIATIIF